MRGRLVAGNWKSNGNFAANERLLGQLSTAAAGLQNVECAVCVPYPYLHQVRQALAGSPVAWGGQDVSQFSAGAYTGRSDGGHAARVRLPLRDCRPFGTPQHFR
jgi:triosephosphate isomerase